MTEGYSHIMQDTPAAVWIPGAQTLSTGPILLARLDGNLGDLKANEKVRCTQDAHQEALGTVQCMCVCVCAH